MPLLQSQTLFARRMATLLQWLHEQPEWSITFGDFNRPDCSGHMGSSLHYIRLAADLNLFVKGEWKKADCPEWQTAGKFWKSLGPEGAWGGDFPKVDLNHFSIRFGGKE